MSTFHVLINQGETFVLGVQWTDATGAAIDLTGATARLQIRDAAGGNVLATYTSSPAVGLTITPSTGTVTWTVAATQSAAWTFRRGYYDLLLTLANGTTKRLVEGDVAISPQVTV